MLRLARGAQSNGTGWQKAMSPHNEEGPRGGAHRGAAVSPIRSQRLRDAPGPPAAYNPMTRFAPESSTTFPRGFRPANTHASTLSEHAAPRTSLPSCASSPNPLSTQGRSKLPAYAFPRTLAHPISLRARGTGLLLRMSGPPEVGGTKPRRFQP